MPNVIEMSGLLVVFSNVLGNLFVTVCHQCGHSDLVTKQEGHSTLQTLQLHVVTAGYLIALSLKEKQGHSVPHVTCLTSGKLAELYNNMMSITHYIHSCTGSAGIMHRHAQASCFMMLVSITQTAIWNRKIFCKERTKQKVRFQQETGEVLLDVSVHKSTSIARTDNNQFESTS